VKYTIDERQQQIKKDLLWDYTTTVSALEAFRATFRDLADRLDVAVRTMRDRPAKE
jgi:hypothetical protein